MSVTCSKSFLCVFHFYIKCLVSGLALCFDFLLKLKLLCTAFRCGKYSLTLWYKSFILGNLKIVHVHFLSTTWKSWGNTCYMDASNYELNENFGIYYSKVQCKTFWNFMHVSKTNNKNNLVLVLLSSIDDEYYQYSKSFQVYMMMVNVWHFMEYMVLHPQLLLRHTQIQQL